MANFAAVADITAQWRALSDEESTRATALLTRASATIRNDFPGIDDRIDAGKLDAEIPKGVAVDMVTRVLGSPHDTVRSVSIDDATMRFQTGREDGRPTSTMYLTDEDKDRLAGKSATRRGRVGTIHAQPTLKP